MKNIVIIGLLALVSCLFLFGCTQQSNNGSGLMALDENTNSVSSNDSNSNVYNNLGEFTKVKAGDKVAVNYIGTLLDGTKFDSSYDRNQTLDFTVGAGQMIAGFDEAVLGMKVGETKKVTLAPEKAYGAVNPKIIFTVDKNSFPDFNKLYIGAQISTTSGATGRVIALTDSNMTVDFNHELAGKTLVFEITLVSIN